MKKLLIPTIVVVLSSVFHVCAAPVSNSGTDMDYIVNESTLSRWCIGVYGDDLDRKVKIKDNGMQLKLEQSRAMAYVGLNIFPWLMVYGTVGEGNTSFEDWTLLPSSQEVQYGGGFQANILTRELPDPTLFENKLRINAGGQYTMTSADVENLDWTWGEVLAYVTISIVNDIAGSKLYLPNSIAIYAGPVYTDVISDDIEQSGDQFGFDVGLEVFFTESVSFDVGMRKIDSAGMTAGVHVRF